MSKRLCSICLCLVLLLACLPAACFAEEYSGAIAVTYTTPTVGDLLSEFQVSADNAQCGQILFLDKTANVLVIPSLKKAYNAVDTSTELTEVPTAFQVNHSYTAYVSLYREEGFAAAQGSKSGYEYKYYKSEITVNTTAALDKTCKIVSTAPASETNYNVLQNIESNAQYLIIHFTFTPKLPSLTISLSVAQDLQLNYSFTNPGTYSQYQMVFTRTPADGGTADEPVSCGVTEENGKLSASYSGISPQRMTDQIQAQLQGSNDGTTWTPVAQSTCSVRDYCDALYGKLGELDYTEAQIAATQKLLADLLAYGSAAQTKQNYAISNLADTNFAGNSYKTNTDLSSFTAPASNLTRSSHTDRTDVSFTGATLVLDHLNFIAFYLKVPESSKADAQVQIYSGSTLLKTVSAADFTAIPAKGENIYRVTSNPLYLSQNRSVLTAKLYVGSELMETVTYSVNSYICAAFSSETVGSLVRQLYAFGESAQAYLTAMNGGTAQ